MKIVQTKTTSGLLYHGLLSTPNSSTRKIIIHIHGMAGTLFQETYYPVMHEYYPQQGFAFLAVEHRGTGTITEFQSDVGTTIIGNALERFEDCIEDVCAWVDFAAGLGYSEIWLQAHSLGSSKVTYYLDQTKDNRVAGLVLLSPADMLGLVHDPIGQQDHDVLYPEAQKLMLAKRPNSLLSHQLWTSVNISAGTYLNFFSDSSNLAIFNYANDRLSWKVVNHITIPVIAMTGTKDDGIFPVMKPHQAMEVLRAQLNNSSRVKTIVYEGAEHGFTGYEHNIVKDVIDFVQQ